MADVSVREARAADVPAISEVQLATWRSSYGGLLPAAALAALDAVEIEAGWSDALTHRPESRARVLVAVDDGRVAGVAALAPATDDDVADDRFAEIGPLLVLPERRGHGHGSRLLAAATDLLREEGFGHALTWVLEADEQARAFLESAGWALDGASRVLDAAGTPLREVRMHTDLSG